MAERDGGKSNRGFAAMDPSKQREIASKGGRAAHAKGTAHEFSSDEAREAGRKGGEVVSRNRQHMADIGRKGGEARGGASRMASARSSESGNGMSAGSRGDVNEGGMRSYGSQTSQSERQSQRNE